MNEFESDLRQVTSDLDDARSGLLGVVNALTTEDLGRGRRGGWSVRDILLHVIGGEREYTNGVRSLRAGAGGRPPQPAGHLAVDLPVDASRLLAESRSDLLTAIDGIEEDVFYRLGPLLNEEGHGQTYSVLSVLENIALHDREHAVQIQDILATGRP